MENKKLHSTKCIWWTKCRHRSRKTSWKLKLKCYYLPRCNNDVSHVFQLSGNGVSSVQYPLFLGRGTHLGHVLTPFWLLTGKNERAGQKPHRASPLVQPLMAAGLQTDLLDISVITCVHTCPRHSQHPAQKHSNTPHAFDLSSLSKLILTDPPPPCFLIPCLCCLFSPCFSNICFIFCPFASFVGSKSGSAAHLLFPRGFRSKSPTASCPSSLEYPSIQNKIWYHLTHKICSFPLFFHLRFMLLPFVKCSILMTCQRVLASP